MSLMFCGASHLLAFFGSLLDIRQFADYTLAAWPRSFSLMHLRDALRRHRQLQQSGSAAS